MLKDEFGAVFIGEYSQYRVIWLVFHNYALVFDMVVLQSVSVVKVDEEYFGEEILNNLPIAFNWENSLFRCLSFDFSQMNLILIV